MDSNVCAFAYFNVYGPNQDPSSPYSGVFSKVLDAITKNKSIVIFGDGEQIRDFVYFLDVVQALILSMDREIHGVFNVGTGLTTSINQLAKQIVQLEDLHIGEIIYKETREGEVRHSCADISIAREKLGYIPGYTLECGLLETYQWWRGN